MSNSKINYFTLGQKFNEGDLYIKDTDYNRKTFQKIINRGRPIKEQFDISIRLKSKKCNYIDFPMSLSSLNFVSDRFKNLLESLPDKDYLEFFPVKIEGVEKPKSNYWVINILDNIKCFDWEESKYTKFPDNESYKDLQSIPEKIIKLKLKQETIGERNIFRMYESATLIFVSSFLKEQMEKEELKGMTFLPSEDFDKQFL